jgi:hypothetical protein
VTEILPEEISKPVCPFSPSPVSTQVYEHQLGDQELRSNLFWEHEIRLKLREQADQVPSAVHSHAIVSCKF